MDLCNACERGNYNEVVKLLQKSAVNINDLVGKHRVRRTALHYASEYGYLKIVKELIAYGANANVTSSDIRLPLHDACIGGHQEILAYLITFTDDINLKDHDGHTPAHVACYQGETQCLQVLLNHDCKIDVKDNSGKSCLDLVVIPDHSETLNLLLQQYPSSFSFNDCNGRVAIHTACQYGALNCLRVFNRHKWDLSCIDNNGVMPIHVAASHGKVSLIDYLIKTGSKLSVPDKTGRCVVHYAAMSRSIVCLHWVLENTFSSSCKDDNDNTPAHYASMNPNSAEMINCLLNHGAILDIENKDGDIPFYCARKSGWPVAFKKAVSGVISCHICQQKADKVQYEEAHKPSLVEQKISSQQFKLQTLQQCSANKVSKIPSQKLQKDVQPKDRNLAGRYYGQEIFDLSNVSGISSRKGSAASSSILRSGK